MQKKPAKKFWKWIKITLIIYIIFGIALYFLQEKFLFHPEKLTAEHVFHFSIPFKEINLTVNDQKNLSIIQFTVPDSACKGVVLYFHGNRRNIERYAPFAVNFTTNNYEVWMIDYPGYGKTTGKRTEQIIYDDARELYKMARARFSKDSIILYGRSLGTGVASYLASVKDCRRLILEAPYYSIEALFSHYAFIYPVGWMSKYHFPTYQYLKKVDAPVSIFHGTNDEVIPYKQSKRLMKIAKPGTELITLDHATHNNLNELSLFHQKLDSILQRP
ncbi:MAG: alpha/beta hydrolase [Chitinophagales bacterium]